MRRARADRAGAAAAWLAHRLDGVDTGFRCDVAATSADAIRSAPHTRARWCEVASLVGLAVRLRARQRTGARAAAVWRHGLVLGFVLLATALGAVRLTGEVAGPPAGTVVSVAATLACPVALAAAGWWDPRLAVAATVLWGWRFLDANTGDLGEAVVAHLWLGDPTLLVRWLAMAAGVALAWWFACTATRRSLRA